MLRILALILFVATGVPVPAEAASFSCENATSHVEKLICADDELSAADEELAYLFNALLSASDNTERIRRDLLAWLATSRNSCPDVACLSGAYEGRIGEIRKALWALPGEARKTVSTDHYYAEEEVFAGNGTKPEESLGKSLVCLTIYSSDRIVLVDFLVAFPDSAQVLSGERIPAKIDAAGNLEFRFIDGWLNRGMGVFKKTGAKNVFTLQMMKSSDDPVAANVGRLYGDYMLERGECKTP